MKLRRRLARVALVAAAIWAASQGSALADCEGGLPCPLPLIGPIVIIMDPGFTVGSHGEMPGIPDKVHPYSCTEHPNVSYRSGRELYLGPNPGNCSWSPSVSECPDPCSSTLSAEIESHRATCGSSEALDSINGLSIHSIIPNPSTGMPRVTFRIDYTATGTVAPRLYFHVANWTWGTVAHVDRFAACSGPTCSEYISTMMNPSTLADPYRIQVTLEEQVCGNGFTYPIGETENHNLVVVGCYKAALWDYGQPDAPAPTCP